MGIARFLAFLVVAAVVAFVFLGMMTGPAIAGAYEEVSASTPIFCFRHVGSEAMRFDCGMTKKPYHATPEIMCLSADRKAYERFDPGTDWIRVEGDDCIPPEERGNGPPVPKGED